MIQVRAPDGSIAQFPDGTPDATIQTVMSKTYGGPKAAQTARPPMSIPMQKASADAKQIVGHGDNDAGPFMAFMNGRTFNFAPEAMGASAAFNTAVDNLGRTLTGKPKPYGAADMFRAATDEARQEASAYSAAHPVANTTLNVAGAVANPVNAMAGRFVSAAPSIPLAMARGAVTGAPIGAVYGAGAAGPGKRTQGAASGAVTGGAIGAIAPPVTAGIGVASRKVLGALGDAATGARNIVKPPDADLPASTVDTQAAIAKLQDLMKAKGIAADALGGADPFGKGVTTAEAIGQPGVVSLGALGRRSGATPDDLRAVLADRSAAAPSRILDDLSTVAGIHPEEAAGNVEALTDRLKKEAGPLFDAVRSQEGPVWNADLAKLAERPVIKKAIGAAGSDLLNAGKDPTALGLVVDPDTGLHVLNPDLSKSTDRFPTAETWDLIRQRIGDQVERHPFTGKILPDSISRGNYNINVAKRDLTNTLAGDPAHGVDGLVPGYRAALDKAGDYLGLQSAFDRGHDAFLNPNISAKDFASTFGDLTEPEQKAWTSGVAAKLNDQLQRGQLTPKRLMLPHVQGKLAAVLGDEGLSALLPRLQAESQLAATGSRMMPGAGSPSMEFINAAGEQEGGPGYLSILSQISRNPVATVGDLAAKGRTLGTSPQVRNELGRLLLQPPQATSAELSSLPPIDRLLLQIPRLPYGAASATAGSVAGQGK